MSGGVPFTNLEDLTNGSLAPAKPDVYYGARPEQLDRRVRDHLAALIIPSTQHDLPIVPNFSLEVKGEDARASVVKRSACYIGALGARGMDSLQAYSAGNSPGDNSAYTISATYHNSLILLYAHYPVCSEAPGHRPTYRIHQLNGWGMTGNIKAFREGATAYRNARAWTKEKRDEAILRANQEVSGAAKGRLVSDVGAQGSPEPPAQEATRVAMNRLQDCRLGLLPRDKLTLRILILILSGIMGNEKQRLDQRTWV